MTHLFISDLHLSSKHPQLIRGFLALLNEYQDKNTHLYILGDWFNAWIGDDYKAPWLDEIVEALNIFTSNQNHVYFLVGNRDFVLGQKFLQQFKGQFLKDIDYLDINDMHIRIEHGDFLCTDDVSYQRFRKIIRQPFILATLKALPLALRQKIANGFRSKSKASKQVKSYDVMDVNQIAVENAMKTCDVLIHGHTHRPEIHQINHKKRIVLGDWRESAAQILEISSETQFQNLQLKTWIYN